MLCNRFSIYLRDGPTTTTTILELMSQRVGVSEPFGGISGVTFVHVFCGVFGGCGVISCVGATIDLFFFEGVGVDLVSRS